jgi:hypothetical protein
MAASRVVSTPRVSRAKTPIAVANPGSGAATAVSGN